MLRSEPAALAVHRRGAAGPERAIPVPVAGEPDRRHHDRDDGRRGGVAEAHRPDRCEEQEDHHEAAADRDGGGGRGSDEASPILGAAIAAAPVRRPPALLEDRRLGGHSRTTRNTPAARSATPTSRSAVTGFSGSPNAPSRSSTTAVDSWPAIVAAVTPPAPSVRTLTSTVVT